MSEDLREINRLLACILHQRTTMRRKAVQCKHISEQEIIDACNAFHRNVYKNPTPDEALAHKYPAKVILAKMARMVDRGILDYGVSLRTAWVNQ